MIPLPMFIHLYQYLAELDCSGRYSYIEEKLEPFLPCVCSDFKTPELSLEPSVEVLKPSSFLSSFFFPLVESVTKEKKKEETIIRTMRFEKKRGKRRISSNGGSPTFDGDLYEIIDGSCAINGTGKGANLSGASFVECFLSPVVMTKYNFVNNAPMRMEMARNRNGAGGNNYLMRRNGCSPFPPPTSTRGRRIANANLQYVVPIVAYFNHPPAPFRRPFPPFPSPLSNQLNSSKSIVFDTGSTPFRVFPLFLEQGTNDPLFVLLFPLPFSTELSGLGRDEGGDRVRVRA